MKKFWIALAICLSLCVTGCDSSSSSSSAPDTSLQLTLLQTTDVHHHVTGTGPMATRGTENDQTIGGYDRLATAINTVRLTKALQHIPVLTFDSGDYLMGTVYDMTLASAPAGLVFLQQMQYDAVTFGNHEFDYGPAPLAGFLNLARSTGFNIPIISSNLDLSAENADAADADYDGLKALQAAGAISPVMVKTLPNGLKVGVIGLLGAQAHVDAPLAGKIFNHDYAALQAQVDALESSEHPDIVVALSHSGLLLYDDGTVGGDDLTLAQQVQGIDIILSGHDHERTDAVISVPNTADPDWKTRIICAGRYGTTLAQLDITLNQDKTVKSATLVNHDMDATVPPHPIMAMIMGQFDNGINDALSPLGLSVDKALAMPEVDLPKPETAGISPQGQLMADSVRHVLQPAYAAHQLAGPSVGIVPNGVIRNGFNKGIPVTFADAYATLPLGFTPFEDNQNIPGYPLLTVWLNGTHLKNICQFDALACAAQDEAFVAYLQANDPTSAAKLGLIKPEYFLHLSGLGWTHDAQYKITGANLFAGEDWTNQGDPVAIVDATYYPCVVDLYTILLLIDPQLQTMMTALGLSVVPALDPAGATAIDGLNFGQARIDGDPVTDGVQEVKEWQSLIKFLTDTPDNGGLAGAIPAAVYK